MRRTLLTVIAGVMVGAGAIALTPSSLLFVPDAVAAHADDVNACRRSISRMS